MPVGDSLSTWATVVLMVPFGILLAMSVFGVDARLATPRAGRSARVRFCEIGDDGTPELADPDGRLWKTRKPVRNIVLEKGVVPIRRAADDSINLSMQKGYVAGMGN